MWRTMLIKFAVGLICVVSVCSTVYCKTSADALHNMHDELKSCDDPYIIVKTLDILLKILKQDSTRVKNAALEQLRENLISISSMLDKPDNADEYINNDEVKTLLRDRNAKNKIVLQIELPNLEQRRCNEAFEELIRTEHEAYIALSKHPMCTVNGRSAKILHKIIDSGNHYGKEEEELSQFNNYDPNLYDFPENSISPDLYQSHSSISSYNQDASLLSMKNFNGTNNVHDLHGIPQNNILSKENMSYGFGADITNENHDSNENPYNSRMHMNNWNPQYQYENGSHNKINIINRTYNERTNTNTPDLSNPPYSFRNKVQGNMLNSFQNQYLNKIERSYQNSKSQSNPKLRSSMYQKFHNANQSKFPAEINVFKPSYNHEYSDQNIKVSSGKHYLNHNEIEQLKAAFSKSNISELGAYPSYPTIDDSNSNKYITNQTFQHSNPINEVFNANFSRNYQKQSDYFSNLKIGDRNAAVYMNKYMPNQNVQPSNPNINMLDDDRSHNHPQQKTYPSYSTIEGINAAYNNKHNIENEHRYNPIVGKLETTNVNVPSNVYSNPPKIYEPYNHFGIINYFKPRNYSHSASPGHINNFHSNNFVAQPKVQNDVLYNQNNIKLQNTILNSAALLQVPNGLPVQDEIIHKKSLSFHEVNTNYLNKLKEKFTSNILALSELLHKLDQSVDNGDILELTYEVKKSQPLLYHPIYIVKYRIPLDTFIENYQHLLIQKPFLRNNPHKLYQETLAMSNITERFGDLQNYPQDALLALTEKDGFLLSAKLVKDDGISKIKSKDKMMMNENNENNYYSGANYVNNPFRRIGTINSPSTLNLNEDESQNYSDLKHEKSVTDKKSELIQSSNRDTSVHHVDSTPNNDTVNISASNYSINPSSTPNLLEVAESREIIPVELVSLEEHPITDSSPTHQGNVSSPSES